MKLKEVIKNACAFLDFNDLKVAIENNNMTEAQTAKVNKFVEYFNLVQEEIATEFLPIFHLESINANDNLMFSSLEKQVLDIIYIKDKNGKKMSFKVFPDCVTFKGTAKEILYSIVPQSVTLSEDILYLAPVRVYCYAIAREHFLNEGLNDVAFMYEERFKNAINSLIEKDKSYPPIIRRSPSRKWL